MTDKHDFKGALDALYNPYNGLSDKHRHVCELALRIADRLQSGEVSVDMLLASDGQHEYNAYLSDEDAKMIFKAMAQQMMKEVEDE